MRSNSLNPNNAAYQGHRGGGGYAGHADADDSQLRYELDELRQNFDGLSGKGFEQRYLDPVVVERYLRMCELEQGIWGLGFLGGDGDPAPLEAIERLVKDGDGLSRRAGLISLLVRTCPGLESQDLALPRIRERFGGWRQEGRVVALHVRFLNTILGGPWEFPRPSGVLVFPKSVQAAMTALKSTPLAELPQEHAQTLIWMLTEPDRCGDWTDPILSAAQCPHCGSRELTPMTEERRHGGGGGSLPLLRFAHQAESFHVHQMRYRICIDCGYVLPFVGDGLDAMRRAFRK